MGIRKFLNLVYKRCTDTAVKNLIIVSKPNPYVYNLQWDAYGRGSTYIVNVKLPNGMFWNITVKATKYQLVINDADGRHEISVRKKCSCSTESQPSNSIIINPCQPFVGSNNKKNEEAGTGFNILQDWKTKCITCDMSPVILSNYKKKDISYDINGITYSDKVELSINVNRIPGFVMISGSINVYPIAGQISGDDQDPITKIASGRYPKIFNATLFNNSNGQDFSWTAQGLNYTLIDDNFCVAEWDIVGKLYGQIVSLKGCKILGEVINEEYNLSFKLSDILVSSGINRGDIIEENPESLIAFVSHKKFNILRFITNLRTPIKNGVWNLRITTRVYNSNNVEIKTKVDDISVLSGYTRNEIEFDYPIMISSDSQKIVIEVFDNSTGESETLLFMK